MQVDYYRQVNKKLVFLGFIEPMDLFFLTPVCSVAFAVGAAEVAIAGFALYFFYGIFFRLGRADGFGYHFFVGRFFTPKSLRPAKLDAPFPYRLPEPGETPAPKKK